MAQRMRLPRAKRCAASLSRILIVISSPGTTGCRRFMAVAMGEIEQAIADPGGGAIGKHLAQRDGEKRIGLIDGDSKLDNRRAKNFDIIGKRRRIEDELAARLEALVERLIGKHPIGTPFAGSEAGRLRR